MKLKDILQELLQIGERISNVILHIYFSAFAICLLLFFSLAPWNDNN